jgi:hypothetical protein
MDPPTGKTTLTAGGEPIINVNILFARVAANPQRRYSKTVLSVHTASSSR